MVTSNSTSRSTTTQNSLKHSWTGCSSATSVDQRKVIALSCPKVQLTETFLPIILLNVSDYSHTEKGIRRELLTTLLQIYCMTVCFQKETENNMISATFPYQKKLQEVLG